MAACKTIILTDNPDIISRYPLGYSTGTTYYTAANSEGKPGGIRTDGASETNKVCPITDISAHIFMGIIDPDFSKNYFDPANPTYFNKTSSRVNLFLLPLTISTDNVTSGDEPTQDTRVFIVDANTFGLTNTNTSLELAGYCIGIDPDDSTRYIIRCEHDFLS